MRKWVIVLIAGVIATATSVARPAAGVKPSSLVILYTSGARGQIRSCNCSKFRFGGYGRELTLLKSIRAQCRDTVLLEGGDITSEGGFQAELKANVAATALKKLGYAAMVPGETDLGIGGANFINHFDSVPILCANAPSIKRSKPYTIVKTANGLRVGIIGLLDDNISRELARVGGHLEVSDPAAAARSCVSKLKGKADIIVVIYHGDDKSASELTGIKGVDLILCTHSGGRDIVFPEKGGNLVKSTVEKRGNVILVKSRTSTNWSLGRIDLQLTSARRIKSAQHSVRYLDRSYSEDPAMVKVYDAYNEKVTQGVLSASKKFKEKSETLLIKRGLNPDEIRKRVHRSPFATAETCKACHADIYENWSKSRHSHAMASLEKMGQSFDPECTSCHVTGASARNGFVNKKENPELVNVQCEACHGPGHEHIKSPAANKFAKVDEQTCRACHTDERSPDFDFDKSWGSIKH
ncbi:MAG: multiheme c-type cytochrome [Armatimonadota bacterium]|nr:hypothetical protein [bacterium]